MNSKFSKHKSEFLPKTGVEYPFMVHRVRFLRTHKMYEPLNENYQAIRLVIEDYR